MKIGITTYWRGTSNYGQIVQHWALQTALSKMGHDPFLIRYYPGYNHGLLKRWIKEYHIADYVRSFYSILKGDKVPFNRILHDRNRNFASFRNNYLSVSVNKYYSLAALQSKPPIADAYVTGSDQVWSQLLSNKENETYFLNFGSKNTKRIAYAPSFSMEEYPSELVPKLRENLSRFNSVSCREHSGVGICCNAGYNTAVKVLDPTFLLRKNDYLKLISQDKNYPHRNHLFIYSLNISSSEEIRWQELKNELNIHDCVVTPSDGYFNGSELFGSDVEYSYGTVQDWLTEIFNSSLVVTPSFHAIALSIILEKDFIYTPLKGECGKGNNRVLDLLCDLGLTDRILTDDKSYSEVAGKAIQWDKVNESLRILRDDSISFLRNSLQL